MQILLIILILWFCGCTTTRRPMVRGYDSVAIVRDSVSVKYGPSDTVTYRKAEYNVKHNKEREFQRKYGWWLIILAVALSIISIILETRK